MLPFFPLLIWRNKRETTRQEKKKGRRWVGGGGGGPALPLPQNVSGGEPSFADAGSKGGREA